MHGHQGNLTQRDEIREHRPCDYSLYIPSHHGRTGSADIERNHTISGGTSALESPGTAAQCTRRMMGAHSGVDLLAPSSRTQSSNPIDLSSLPFAGTSKMLVSPRPLKLAEYLILGPAIPVASSGDKVDKGNEDADDDSQTLLENESSRQPGGAQVEASRTNGGREQRSDSRKPMLLTIDVSKLQPSEALRSAFATKFSSRTTVSQISPESARKTPDSFQMTPRRSSMLEMLQSASIVRSSRNGAVTRELLSPATDDDDSSPECPRRRLHRRSNSPNSPRRSPIAMRGKNPPLLLPGADMSAAKGSVLGHYLGGPIKEFGASRTASAEKRQLDEEENMVIMVQPPSEHGSDQASDGDLPVQRPLSAGDDSFKKRTYTHAKFTSVVDLDFSRTASDYTVPSTEPSSPLDSPTRFGGRYSPRDGRAMGVAVTASGEEFERTLSAARAAPNDTFQRTPSHRLSKTDGRAGSCDSFEHSSLQQSSVSLSESHNQVAPSAETVHPTDPQPPGPHSLAHHGQPVFLASST